MRLGVIMSELIYQFDCGCKVKQFGTDVKECDGLPPLNIDYYNLPECPLIWDYFCQGNTKGVFQLETNVGKGISKNIGPRNIEELSALIALMRPGCANSMSEGKSMTDHYIDRKHGREPVKNIDDAISDLLEDTYQVLVFQEQSIAIAVKIAGLTPVEADMLRKSMGTKDAAMMNQVETLFISGCRKVGLVSDEQAQNIFNMIRASNRYAFNRSHSVEYAIVGTWCMWLKYHFPLHFFTSWLYYADEKMDTRYEIAGLYNNAKQMGIDIYTPSLDKLFYGDLGKFSLTKKGIHFGISDVKGIGTSQTQKIVNRVREVEKLLGKSITQFSWNEFLILISDYTTKTVMNNLIMAGFFGKFKEDRRKLLYDYNIWSEFNDREKAWFVKQNVNRPFADLLKEYIEVPKKNNGPSNINRKKKVQDIYNQYISPSSSNTDTISEIAKYEKELLGVSITCTQKDSVGYASGTCTCKDYLDGKSENLCFAVEIKEAEVHNIKRGPSAGQKKIVLVIEDETGVIENVSCYSECYENYRDLLYEGNVVMLKGYKSKKGQLVIQNVKQIS